MSEEKHVFVELKENCYVDGKLREKGEVVSMPETSAKDFGKIIPKVKAAEALAEAEEDKNK